MPFLFAMWLREAIWLACAVFGLVAIAQTFQGLSPSSSMPASPIFSSRLEDVDRAIDDRGRRSHRDFAAAMFLARLRRHREARSRSVFYVALLPVIIDLSQVTLLHGRN